MVLYEMVNTLRLYMSLTGRNLQSATKAKKTNEAYLNNEINICRGQQ